MSITEAAQRTPPRRFWVNAHHAVVPTRWEAVTVLTTVLFMIMIIPERLVLKPLGAAGRPGSLLAVACLLWWLDVTLVRGIGAERNRTARIVLTPLCLAILVSYVMAMSRPIDGVEMRSADRGLINLAAWAGVWMLTAESVRDRQQLEKLLNRLVLFGSIMGLIGILQSLVGLDLTQWMTVPGLSANSAAEELSRNGLARPASTTSHPIEFGVVMAMLVPLALHQFFHAAPDKQRWARNRLLLVAAAAVMSVSRSAVLGMVVAGIMLGPSLPRERRRQLGWATLGFLVVMKFVAPGLIGTLLHLFTGISGDDSAASRTGSYAAVWPYIKERPIFGRGFATFLPSYHILDNQLLGSLIEIGVVGVAALLWLLFAGPVLAWRAGKRSVEPTRRSLGLSLSAAAVVPALSFATFDAFGFSVIATLTFFIGGCCCAFARMPVPDPPPVPALATPQPPAPPALATPQPPVPPPPPAPQPPAPRLPTIPQET